MNWKMQFAALTAIGIALVHADASAQGSINSARPTSYKTNADDMRPMGLGFGLTPSALNTPPSANICVKVPKMAPLDRPMGVGSVTLSSRLVSSQSHLFEARNLAVSAYAQDPRGGVAASFSEKSSEALSSNNVTIIVSGSQMSKPLMFDGPVKLTDEAEDLLKNDVSEFKRRCGTQYVAAVKRGASFNVYITITQAYVELKNARAAEVTANGGSGAVRAGFAAQFDQAMKRAKDDRTVDVQLDARGGPGLQALGNLVEATITSKPSIDEIGKAIAQYLSGSDKDQYASKFTWEDLSAPLEIVVADYPGLAQAEQDPWTVEKESRMAALVDRYWRYKSREATANRIANGEDPRFDKTDKAAQERHKAIEERQSKAVTAVIGAHSKCKGSTTANLDQDCNVRSLDDTQELRAANADDIVRPPAKPSGTWGLAVMKKVGGQEKWRLLNRGETLRVFTSQYAANPPTTYLVKHTADYRERLRRRLEGTVGGAIDAYVLLYLIDSDSLAEFSIFNDWWTTSAARGSKMVFAQGKYPVSTGNATPKPLVPTALSAAPLLINADTNDWPHKHAVRLYKYPDDAKIDLHWDMGGPWVTVADEAVHAPGVGSGQGWLKIQMNDAFLPGNAGIKVESLRTWKWLNDDTAQVRLVEYQNTTGEPADFYVSPTPGGEFPYPKPKIYPTNIQSDGNHRPQIRIHSPLFLAPADVQNEHTTSVQERDGGACVATVKLSPNGPRRGASFLIAEASANYVAGAFGAGRLCKEREYVFSGEYTLHFCHKLREPKNPYEGPTICQ